MTEREKRHTQGPWQAGPTEDAHVVAEVGNYSVYPPGDTFGEPDADAHLCAAAPELLEALEAMLDDGTFVGGFHAEWVPIDAAIAKADAAIAKAYGEGDNQ